MEKIVQWFTGAWAKVRADWKGVAVLVLVALLLCGLIIRAIVYSGKVADLQSELAEYRFLATSSINGLVASNRSISAELEQQKRNTANAVEAITRAITISESSSAAYSQLIALSDEDRILLERLRYNTTTSLRLVKERLSGKVGGTTAGANP